MNIKALHTQEKIISAASFFKTQQANITAIQILQGKQFKEHTTKIPALLLCVVGRVSFENEKGVEEILLSGDYVNIEPDVRYWINGLSDSQLLFMC